MTSSRSRRSDRHITHPSCISLIPATPHIIRCSSISFPVRVKSRYPIGELKKSIKTEKSNCFKHDDADSLDGTKVSFFESIHLWSLRDGTG